MKIVHVISTLNIAGAENFVVQLANQQAMDHKVTIIITGITNISSNYFDQIRENIILYPLGWTKKYSLRQFFQLYRLINRLKPDHICAHLHNPFYYVYGISFLKTNIRYMHTIHSSFTNWRQILRILNVLRVINNRILHVCVAKSIYEELQHNFPKLKTTLITNGIKRYTLQREITQVEALWNSFAIKPKKGKRFLAIGNINRHKNFKLLAHCFTRVFEAFPDAMCMHIGSYMDKFLSDELKEINAPNLFLAGPHPNAADFLSQADALIISSVQEGMPIVVLEALSMGVPIISTPAGGLKDVIINGHNGMLIQDFEIESLSKAIIKFIESSANEKSKLRQNARSDFERHYEIGEISKFYQNMSA